MDGVWSQSQGQHEDVETSRLAALVGSLGAFALVYNKVGDLMPTIVKLCEVDIKISTA